MLEVLCVEPGSGYACPVPIDAATSLAYRVGIAQGIRLMRSQGSKPLVLQYDPVSRGALVPKLPCKTRGFEPLPLIVIAPNDTAASGCRLSPIC